MVMVNDLATRIKLIQEIEKNRNSTVLVYVHDDSLSYKHVPDFYNELRKIGVVENLDIFLYSLGGDPDAAYKMVRMCREHCTGKLSVIVPFMAKSAATLLAIGTDEIVMGPPSELGPIDPQILDKASQSWGATQSIRDCVDFLETRIYQSNDPAKTSYVLMPILDKLNPFMIGMYERAVKMSKQYAELLLKNGMLKNQTPQILEMVTSKLSESYYSHGYAINRKEAKEELHLNIVNCEVRLWDIIWNLFVSYHQEMTSKKEYCTFIESRKSIERRMQQSPIDIITEKIQQKLRERDLAMDEAIEEALNELDEPNNISIEPVDDNDESTIQNEDDSLPDTESNQPEVEELSEYNEHENQGDGNT
jgi:hypothetical protein